jgi:hypothetical protein
VRVTTICPGFVRTDLTAGNPFPMPFVIDADEAARSICDGLERERTEIVFPTRMALLVKTARLVPARAWTALPTSAPPTVPPPRAGRRRPAPTAGRYSPQGGRAGSAPQPHRTAPQYARWEFWMQKPAASLLRRREAVGAVDTASRSWLRPKGKRRG